jgi:photosystem II stability/assembly factor-like uncharacterized protein
MASGNAEALNSSNGALFVQPDGPNTEFFYVGCVDVDGPEEPGGGINELLRCFNATGDGWRTISYTTTPPDPITMTITSLIGKRLSYLEHIKGCPAPYYLAQRESGRADQFDNYARMKILPVAIVGDRGHSNLVMREEDTAAQKTFAISALPPALDVTKLIATRVSTAETNALNDIAFIDDIRCASEAGPAQKAGKHGYIVADAGTGVTANVLYSSNYGATWAATAADPLAADIHILSVVAFALSPTINRVVVAKGSTEAGAAAKVAYSDNNGTSWTTVLVGSTNAQFAQNSNALFALDPFNMWLVVNGGYIYKSADSGATWTTQEAGVATANILRAVHFVDNKIGFAAGASDTVLRTIDGGFSWSVVTTAPGSGGGVNAVFGINSQKAWVGTDNGRLYYTEDGGATWTRRSFSGDGAGAVKQIRFINSTIGFMVHDTAAPAGRLFRTLNGGYTWELFSVATNSGLNAAAVLDENNAFMVGEANNGTGVIIKAQPAQ